MLLLIWGGGGPATVLSAHGEGKNLRARAVPLEARPVTMQRRNIRFEPKDRQYQPRKGPY